MLNEIQKALILAAYFRGNLPDGIFTSGCDEVITLSLFYTGDISREDCIERFARRSYMKKLYQEDRYELTDEIRERYESLIELIFSHPELLEGGGDLRLPALPTFTGCRLTRAGVAMAENLLPQFPRKPEFPNWHDTRPIPAM